MASAIAAQGVADARPDLLGIVLGDHADVVDEVGEQGGHDPPVTDLDDLRSDARRGPTARLNETGAALVAEPGPSVSLWRRTPGTAPRGLPSSRSEGASV